MGRGGVGSKVPVEVWLTGFGAFPGAASNPSQTLVRHISRDGRRRLELHGIHLTTDILPVVYDEALERLARSRRAAEPDVILHLGLAGRRRAMSVETRAANRVSTLHADAARRRSPTRSLEPGGDPWRRSEIPAVQLVAAMEAIGVPAKRSIDAGDYVCNQVLYRSLGREKALAAFIHLPRPLGERRPKHDRDDGRLPRIRLADMQKAVEAAILLLAQEARRRKRPVDSTSGA